MNKQLVENLEVEIDKLKAEIATLEAKTKEKKLDLARNDERLKMENARPANTQKET